MRTTYPEAYFRFVDVTALGDGRTASTTAKDFSNYPLFYDKSVRQAPYGTMEHNQFVLDGSRKIFPAAGPEDVPWWSDEKSDAEGSYVKPPSLEISFTQPHSSIGLTLYYAEDYPAEVRITWYTLYGSKLCSQVFYPNSREYFCQRQVQNYGKLVIEILQSAFPFRYAKLDHVEYGRIWLLGREDIKTASIYEELDPTSATLSVNTARLEIVDAAGEFDPSRQEGLWKSLQKEQKVALTEYVDGIPVDCGAFYLDTWECQKNLARFEMKDLLGIIDKTNFYGGRVYHREKAGAILEAVMASCGVESYQVEEEVAHMELSGWLGIQSHRAALQQVVFACGAVADCSRRDGIRIYRPDRHVSRTIGTDRRFQGAKVSMEEYVSSVTVAYTRYTAGGEEKQISKGILEAGRHRIEFGAPYLAESIRASAGVILEARTNYVLLELEEGGECVLTGCRYEAEENACTAAVSVIEAGENACTRTYKGCTLLDAERAEELARRLLHHHQTRQALELRYINDGEGVGNWCDVAMRDGAQNTTCILNQTLDLTGGNLATARCLGYQRRTTEDHFAGREIYAGEDTGI